MNDADAMRLVHRRARLAHAVDRTLEREGPVAIQHITKVRTLEVLHHHVQDAATDATDVENLRDVDCPQARDGARLIEKARSRFWVIDVLGSHYLDRDRLVQGQVPAAI